MKNLIFSLIFPALIFSQDVPNTHLAPPKLNFVTTTNIVQVKTWNILSTNYETERSGNIFEHITKVYNIQIGEVEGKQFRINKTLIWQTNRFIQQPIHEAHKDVQHKEK